MTQKDEAQELAHIWQAHRIRCLELAIQAGAPPAEAISVAEEFGKYILTKSDIEIAQASKKADDA
jgi:hypothetical protein